ncbi:MAG: alanine racemase [Finegoldia sp.]|nr:alanine racemase [Finegoldia sp.]
MDYQTYFQVNLDNFIHNYKQLKENSGVTKMCAVIKANAYGHGAVKLARELEFLGADYLAVANILEALELRRNGIRLPILVLGYIGEENISVAIENNISLTVYSYQMAELINQKAKNLRKIPKVHVKIDTGMNRLGFQVLVDKDKCIRDIFKIDKMENVIVEGIFSHFADADGEDSAFTNEQYKTFIGFLIDLENAGVTIPIKHIANDPGSIIYGYDMDMIRCGLGLYGYNSSDFVDKNSKLDLRPVGSLYSTVTMVKDVAKNSKIGYNCTYTTDSQTGVATVAIGYADGYPVELSNKAYVIINGKKAQILGKVCMDQLMVDVSFVRDVKVGDRVLLFGEGDGKNLDLKELVGMTHSSVYEFLCNVSRRVARVYTKNGKVVDKMDYLLS